jgi:hypothetical protein
MSLGVIEAMTSVTIFFIICCYLSYSMENTAMHRKNH